MCKFVLFILFFISLQVKAEYRAYQYLVQNIENINNKKSKISNTVISTLDPVSYVSYHGGPASTSVTLLNTWMCPGNTSHTNTCLPLENKGGLSD